ncbi:hypothetical protein As57867_023026, partial [Aphanomyces stellatus]
ALSLSLTMCSTSLVGAPSQFLLNTTLLPDQTVIPKLQAFAQIAQQDVYQLGVEFFQFGKKNTTTSEVLLLRQNIFDPAVPEFFFLAWQLATDWVTAGREVISIEGDIGIINVISPSSAALSSLSNPLEIPLNVSGYIRYVCLYVTVVIICVAILATIYLVLSRGYVEGLNFFELNRVGGLVWVGRTFLFVRSVAAISLLSTEVLAMEYGNNFWHFNSIAQLIGESSTDKAIRLFKTVLAAGEMSWLGFVLSDMLMVFTQQYSPAYVFKCNFVVWGASAILSLAAPTAHTATINRQCELAQVDFQLVCSSGVIEIGNVGRFSLLIGIVVISISLCYAYERIRHPKAPNTQPNSFFLSTSAKYVFEPARWIDREVYHLDPSSAALNGILSFQSKNTHYIFDMKIWRLFIIETPAAERKRLEDAGELHLLSAIPLTD